MIRYWMILVSLAVFYQPVVAQPGLLWMNPYGTPNDDYCEEVMNTQDGGAVFAGSLGGPDNCATLMKVNSDGQIVWAHQYVESLFTWCVNAIQVPGGGFVLVGGTTNGVDISSVMIRTDNQGNQLWLNTYDYGFFSDLFGMAFQSVSLEPGGGFSITTSSEAGDVILIKTDESGNVLEEYTIPHPVGWDYVVPMDHVTYPNGNIAIAGTTIIMNDFQEDGYLLVVDQNGQVLNETLFGDQYYQEFHDIVIRPDSGLCLVGDSSDDYFHCVQFFADSIGQIEDVVFHGPEFDHCNGRGICTTQDGGYLIGGRYSGNQAWIFKTDATGDVLWEFIAEQTGDERCVSLVENATGGVYAAGYTESIGNGMQDWLMISLESELPVSISLYPVSTTEFPATGGTLSYYVHLQSSIPASMNGLLYWTDIILPNATIYGPTYQQQFNLTPFMDYNSPVLHQDIPPFAPSGRYQFRGHAGFPNSLHASNSFSFTKAGTAEEEAPANSWYACGEFITEALLKPDSESNYSLQVQASPNPFNAQTTIHYALPHPSDMKLDVFDVLGRHVATLAEGAYPAGAYEVTFDGSNLASGTYYLKATADEQSFERKLVLMK